MTFLQKQNCMTNVMNVLKKITILLYDRFGFVINMKTLRLVKLRKHVYQLQSYYLFSTESLNH